MFVRGDTVVTSASDITAVANCEFAFLRTFDAQLGRDVVNPLDDDPMKARAAELGNIHEIEQLREYRRQCGDDLVTQIARPASQSLDDIAVRATETLAALRSDAMVVFQATFFDPQQRAPEPGEPTIAFVGYADFLAKSAAGVWQVQDTKLARRAKVPALLQLAAYAEQLERCSIPVSAQALLILGDRSQSIHTVADAAPLLRARRARMIELILQSWQRTGATRERSQARPIEWDAPDVSACGRCHICAPEVELSRDPLLIARLTLAQRAKLMEAGLRSIDDVAKARDAVLEGELHISGMSTSTLDRITAQARAQIASAEGEPPAVEVVNAGALAAIPEPNEGDLFFDFEGEPFFRGESNTGVPVWGIDYLFGMVDASEKFTAFWAHTLEEERQALIDFIDFVQERRTLYPNMRIYHYAPYERTHLLSLAARHGVCEQAVDELLRADVLVDLYAITRNALIVGSRSYSIKKLEPLYMGDEHRDDGGVTSGGESVIEYVIAGELLRSPDEAESAEGQRRLDAIADYNQYDCISTLRLRDYLLGIAFEHGVTPDVRAASPDTSGDGDDTEEARLNLDPLSGLGAKLSLAAEELAEYPRYRAARNTVALAASAIDYHQREDKSFWHDHYGRLVDPIAEWADTKDVFTADGRAEVIEDWNRPSRARKRQRIIHLAGAFAPGSTVGVDADVFAVYEPPFLGPGRTGSMVKRRAIEAQIVAIDETGVTIRERENEHDTYPDSVPVALTPGAPPRAGTQKSAIKEWGASIALAVDAATDEHGRFQPPRFTLPEDPVIDLLSRRPPRLVGGGEPLDPSSADALAAGGHEQARLVGATTASLRKSSNTYLAVQGPPGTGKTYLGAHVIRRLVEEDGWHVGVVAQSHRVIENLLQAVVDAGLDPTQVGKVPQRGTAKSADSSVPSLESTRSFTKLKYNGHRAFVNEHRSAGRGSVLGGTAWDFSSERRFDRRSLDLLVIDEAGQFSLAPTIASSIATQRLLLLGDPQQLPQVSQGSHPEPVDASALGWLLGREETLSPSYGYFLPETRRMHAALADVVSELSYDGRLRSHESALGLEVLGVGRPGLVWHPVTHAGNTTHSVEEADVVANLVVEALLGSVRYKPDAAFVPFTEDDVIVVAPYNAQVDCVREALGLRGLTQVRVGTVDKFQGQEALVAIVTLAASKPDDIPRGLDFLLMRNRLNVAISRAKWCAHLVSSAKLGQTGLPSTSESVSALSAYLRLTERGRAASDTLVR